VTKHFCLESRPLAIWYVLVSQCYLRLLKLHNFASIQDFVLQAHFSRLNLTQDINGTKNTSATLKIFFFLLLSNTNKYTNHPTTNKLYSIRLFLKRWQADQEITWFDRSWRFNEIFIEAYYWNGHLKSVYTFIPYFSMIHLIWYSYLCLDIPSDLFPLSLPSNFVSIPHFPHIWYMSNISFYFIAIKILR
jgi:hypothetical protein